MMLVLRSVLRGASTARAVVPALSPGTGQGMRVAVASAGTRCLSTAPRALYAQDGQNSSQNQPQQQQQQQSKKKRSMLDDVLQSASSQPSAPRNMRSRQGRGGAGGTGGGTGGTGGAGGAGGSGPGRGGRHQQQGHQGKQQRRQQGAGGPDTPRQAIQMYADWQLSEIKALQKELQQHIESGHIAEDSAEAQEVRKMLEAAKSDLQPERPFYQVNVPMPEGGFRRQYTFDTPELHPIHVEKQKMPGFTRTHAVYNKRVSNMTRGGRRPSMSALVLAGNGKGGLGFAVAKGTETRIAEQKAANRATRSLQYIYRLDGRTIAHDVQAKFLKTKVYMRPAKPGAGVKAHPLIEIMCNLTGIEDLTADVFGSKNPLNVVRAAMEAFKAQQDPLDVAKQRQKTLIQIDDPGRLPRILYSPPDRAIQRAHPSAVRHGIKKWIRKFPRPNDIRALGSAKQAFDELLQLAQQQGAEESEKRDAAREVLKTAQGQAVLARLGPRVAAWMRKQPLAASALDLMVYTRHSFLDDTFWPGGVASSLQHHARLQQQQQQQQEAQS